MDDQEIMVQLPAEAETLSLLDSILTGSGPHTDSYAMGTGVKQLKREADD
jgi:hypothetical protein